MNIAINWEMSPKALVSLETRTWGLEVAKGNSLMKALLMMLLNYASIFAFLKYLNLFNYINIITTKEIVVRWRSA